MTNDLADRTHCNYGHEYVPKNITWRKDGGRACKACRRANKTRNKIRRAKMKSDVEDSLAKKNQLDYLKLNDDQARKSDGVNFAVDRAKSRPPCESDPDRWQFDVDAPPSSWPTSQEAQDMCVGCPFLQECFAYGESLKSKDNCGVWGGVRFVYGKRLN